MSNIENVNIVFNYCKRYFNHHKKFPRIDKIMTALNLSRAKVKEILRYLIYENKIKKNYSYYYFPGTLKKEKSLNLNKEKKTNIFNDVLNIFNKFIDNSKILLLKLTMLIICCITVYLSVIFTYLWFTAFFNEFRSLLFSLAFVGTSLTTFQFAIIFKNSKKIKLSIACFIIWFGVVSFSIITGLSGQIILEMNKKIELSKSDIKSDNELLLYEEYKEDINQIEIELNSVRKEREKLQEILSNTSYDTTSDKIEYKNINYRISLKNNQINKLREELKKIRVKKENMLKEKDLKINVEKKTDFFIWIEKTFKINSNKFKFILYLIFSIFVDIIAPINFGIVLFYKKEENV